MTLPFRQSRRDFLKVSTAAGGGLALQLAIPASALAQAAAKGKAPELTAWIVINPDSSVVIRVARSEMGQGSSTGLAMLVAAAAQRWKVPGSECDAENGVVIHRPSRRRLRFGQVAQAASKIEPSGEVKLKDPKDWNLIGKPAPRLDISDKVTGKPLFGIDVQLLGMVYAAIAQCPVFRGRLRSVADERILGLRGLIKVVKLEDAVAVVADNWWRANRMLKALPIE